MAANGDRRCQEPGCARLHYARGWCGMHYKRWLRTGSPVRGLPPTTCAVDGCERDAKTRGWCHGHYQRWRTHGDVRSDVPLRARAPCEVDGCDRRSHARGYCATHYKRLVLTGDVRAGEPIRIVSGRGFEHHGYWIVPVEREDRWLVNGEHKAAEHRLVMARHLGRPLCADEAVHHRNGVRTDNRLENLELWSVSHPSGQRVEDKVAWAVEFLHRYRPWLLRGVSERSEDRHRDG